MEEKEFTAREVATLVEDLKSEFRTVAEVVLPLREDMSEVKDRLSAVEDRLTHVEDALRVGFPQINSRLDSLETKAG